MHALIKTVHTLILYWTRVAVHNRTLKSDGHVKVRWFAPKHNDVTSESSRAVAVQSNCPNYSKHFFFKFKTIFEITDASKNKCIKMRISTASACQLCARIIDF